MATYYGFVTFFKRIVVLSCGCQCWCLRFPYPLLMLNRHCNYIFIHPVALARRQLGNLRVKLPPVYHHTRWRLHTVLFNSWTSSRKLKIPIFMVFGLTRLEIEPEFTVLVAYEYALFTRPLVGTDATLKNFYVIGLCYSTKIFSSRNQRVQRSIF